MKWLFIIIVALTMLPNAYAKDCYNNGWFCIDIDESTGHVLLFNQTQFPVVVSFNGRWRDQHGNRQNLKKTLSLSASEEVTVIEFDYRGARRSLNYSVNWVGGVLDAQHDSNAVYYYPFAPGKTYRLVQGFGGGFSHYGPSKYAVDFAMPVGTPVHAARGGTVIDVEYRNDKGGSSRRYARYANYIVILHEDGTTGEYYHLRKNGVVVRQGDRISAGQLIGYSGNTGFSSMPHLHFAVYKAMENAKYQSIPFTFSAAP